MIKVRIFCDDFSLIAWFPSISEIEDAVTELESATEDMVLFEMLDD